MDYSYFVDDFYQSFKLWVNFFFCPLFSPFFFLFTLSCSILNDASFSLMRAHFARKSAHDAILVFLFMGGFAILLYFC